MSAVPLNLGVPTGTVMWFCAPEPPTGWLVCDGSTHQASDFPALFYSIGYTYGGTGSQFQVPDMVGKFFRAWGENIGRIFASTEEDSFKSHRHGMSPGITHDHVLVDPGHEHTTVEFAHQHATTSDHAHGNTDPSHYHQDEFYTEGYSSLPFIFPNCNQEVYYTGFSYCSRHSKPTADCPTCTSFTSNSVIQSAKTGITVVNAVTGITSLGTSKTGVTFVKQFSGLVAVESQTLMEVEDYGAPNTRPANIALLPIIRT